MDDRLKWMRNSEGFVAYPETAGDSARMAREVEDGEGRCWRHPETMTALNVARQGLKSRAA